MATVALFLLPGSVLEILQPLSSEERKQLVADMICLETDDMAPRQHRLILTVFRDGEPRQRKQFVDQVLMLQHYVSRCDDDQAEVIRVLYLVAQVTQGKRLLS